MKSWLDKRDTIKIAMDICTNAEGDTYLVTDLYLNGTCINAYISFTDFLFYDKDNKYKSCQGKWSAFTPLTCSCGDAGCAGYYDGIHTKHLKHTVEWRIPADMGYTGKLDKTFYSFDKRMYYKQVEGIKQFLRDNADTLITSEDYDDGTKIKLSEEYSRVWEEILK